MRRMNMHLNEVIESGPYPEHPGEQDCAHYIRTGLCKYGITCRFNHPPNRMLAVAAARIKGEYPERSGQPECQYYLKTGTCKFGVTCKFHHPRDEAGIAGRVQLNILGYPLRPSEKECAYYLRTLQCKFGSTCKFHHPQPSNAMVSFRGSPVYPPVHSPTTPGPQSYPGLSSWPLSRASFIPSPHWQGPSSYAQLILPHGVVPVAGWNPYPGQMGPVSSAEKDQESSNISQIYRTSHQSEPPNSTTQGIFYRSGSVPVGLYALHKENVFPERPDQPECEYYMKTGDCKFGAICKFHHPRERQIPVPSCMLSPLGLPLRPGEPLCTFYFHNGTCKFGQNCKFDHSMGIAYGFSPSSTADVPVWRLLGSSSGSNAIPSSTAWPAEAGKRKSRKPSLSGTRKMPSGDENI